MASALVRFQWAPLLTGEISPSGYGGSGWNPRYFNGLPFLQGRSAHEPSDTTEVVAISMGSPSYRGDQSRDPGTLSGLAGLISMGSPSYRGDQPRGLCECPEILIISMGSPSYRGDQPFCFLWAEQSRVLFQWAPLLTGEISPSYFRLLGPNWSSFNGLPFLQGRSGEWVQVVELGVPFVVSMGSPSYRGDQPSAPGRSVR